MWNILKFELRDTFENYKDKLVVLGTAVFFCYFMGWTTLFTKSFSSVLALIYLLAVYVIPNGIIIYGKKSPASLFYSLTEYKENLCPVSSWKIIFAKSLSLVIVFRVFFWTAMIVFWLLACAGSWCNTNFSWFIKTTLFNSEMKNMGVIFNDGSFLEKFAFLWKNVFGTGIYGFIDNFPLRIFLMVNIAGLVYGFFYSFLKTSRRFIPAILSFVISLAFILAVSFLRDKIHEIGPDTGRILNIILGGGLAVLVVYLEGRIFDRRFRN